MVIKDERNFVPIIARMLKGLKYQNVQIIKGEPKAVDITAEKDGLKYCFGCQYAIDAIGEKKIQTFAEAAKTTHSDVLVFVTNSSFLSQAKKRGDAEGIELWERNTVDRLAIGVSENIYEDNIYDANGRKERKPKKVDNKEESVTAAPKKKRRIYAIIVVVAVLLAVGAVAFFYFT